MLIDVLILMVSGLTGAYIQHLFDKRTLEKSKVINKKRNLTIRVVCAVLYMLGWCYLGWNGVILQSAIEAVFGILVLVYWFWLPFDVMMAWYLNKDWMFLGTTGFIDRATRGYSTEVTVVKLIGMITTPIFYILLQYGY